MFLYTCQACLDGDHQNCERGANPEKGMLYGSSRCVCYCLGHPKKQIIHDWEKNMAKIMESTITHNSK